MNIYQTTTDRILAQMETGIMPWRQTWQAGLPSSLASRREYRGINILVLAAAGYSSRYWLTFREALRLGGHVRKGEKATTVVYWKWRTPEDLRQAAKETGRTDLPRCVPFTGNVFNLEQVEGVERPNDEVRQEPHRRLELADQILEVMPDKPEVTHSVAHQPAYDLVADRIMLPHLSQFESADEYFSTLFHELVHATGHQKRLNRFRTHEGTSLEKYSHEELVAEFGAAFLCGFCGIKNPGLEELQASYIANWAEVFRKDNRILLRAASAAQRAADFVRGKVVIESQVVTQ